MKEGNSLIALPQQLVEGNIKAAEGQPCLFGGWRFLASLQVCL